MQTVAVGRGQGVRGRAKQGLLMLGWRGGECVEGVEKDGLER